MQTWACYRNPAGSDDISDLSIIGVDLPGGAHGPRSGSEVGGSSVGAALQAMDAETSRGTGGARSTTIDETCAEGGNMWIMCALDVFSST